jgi:hypothetical protein
MLKDGFGHSCKACTSVRSNVDAATNGAMGNVARRNQTGPPIGLTHTPPKIIVDAEMRSYKKQLAPLVYHVNKPSQQLVTALSSPCLNSSPF